MTKAPLRESITKDGQAYVDEPIIVRPKTAPVADAVGQAFGAARKDAITVAHERVRLQWMTTNKKGELVARAPLKRA